MEDEGKSNKLQNHSYLTCLSAREDNRNKLANTSFSSSSSVEGQQLSSTSNLVHAEIEEDEETGLLGKNHSHKHENMATQRKGEASPQNDLPIDNINEMINTARPLSCFEDCYIYRVSPRLREVNEKAYTPQVVSIGPLHHKNENLKAMEEVKVRYLEQFLVLAAKTAMLKDCSPTTEAKQRAFLILQQVGTEKLNQYSCLDKFLSILKSSEVKIRKSYSEDLNHLTSDDLLKIILVDAAFIIEFFLRLTGFYKGRGCILPSPVEATDIRMDLALLENQVPFFVLENLYDEAFGSYPNIYGTFLALSCCYFRVYDHQRSIEGKILHFTDLLRTFFLPIPKDEGQSRNAAAPEENYSDSILKIFTCFLRSGRKHEDQIGQSYYRLIKLDEHLKSATQLHAAGVVFTPSTSRSLHDVYFSEPKLEIPCLPLAEETEVIFRNLMALEQNLYQERAIICDYITLMDYLINTGEDVELLVEKKIIKNWLGSNEEAASLFNRLRTNIIKGFINCHFHSLTNELNAYYAKPCNRWRATLRRRYFNTPWRSASTIAAVILLLLTLAQTILAVVSIYKGGRQ